MLLGGGGVAESIKSGPGLRATAAAPENLRAGPLFQLRLSAFVTTRHLILLGLSGATYATKSFTVAPNYPR